MAAMLLPFLTFQLLLPVAWAQSAKSCGGPNDHVKNPVIKVTPDPPQPGGQLTIQASGQLDEDLTDFTASVDLKVHTLRIIHSSISGALPVSISPALAKGPFSLNIGPIQLPDRPGSGSTSVEGQIHVVDGKNEPVLCMDLNIQVGPGGDIMEGYKVEEQAHKAEVGDISSCGHPSDHIPDFKVTQSDGVVTATGTLNEQVAVAGLALDAKIKVLFFSEPLHLNAPISFSPSAVKGPFKATFGPSNITLEPHISGTLTGTVKLNDNQGQELTCVSIKGELSSQEELVI